MRPFSTARFCAIVICGLLLKPAPASATWLSISQYGDGNLNCSQLSREAFVMKSIIAQTQDERQDSKMQTQGIGVVGTAASFVVGSVTGGLGIAAAGLFARHASDQAGNEAEAIQDIAQQRRALMVGLFKGKDCVGPVEGALQDAYRPSMLNQLATAAGDVRPIPERDYNQ